MKVTINNLDIGADNKMVLTTPIQGLYTPSIRTSSGNYSGRDGGFISTQNYAPRQIVIKGIINASSCGEYETLSCQLINAVPIRTTLPFIFTSNSNNEYYADTQLIDLQWDITDNTYAEYQMTLLAPDPYFYVINDGTDDEGWISQSLGIIVGGGYVFPYVLPVTWGAGTGSTIINNTTDIPIYPVITLNDKMTTPRITNTTTGEFIEINLSMSTGDELVIDSYNRTITLNGASALYLKTDSSYWWAIIAGSNTIGLSTQSGSDDGTGTIKYRLPYVGVMSDVC